MLFLLYVTHMPYFCCIFSPSLQILNCKSSLDSKFLEPSTLMTMVSSINIEA